MALDIRTEDITVFYRENYTTTDVQQRILKVLGEYPILNQTLLGTIIQGGGRTMNESALAQLEQDKKIVAIIPHPGTNVSYRYCLPEYVELLAPFIHRKKTHSRDLPSLYERIQDRLLTYPILYRSLLTASLQTSLIGEALEKLEKDGIISSVLMRSGSRTTPRYYLSAYEETLRPFFRRE